MNDEPQDYARESTELFDMLKRTGLKGREVNFIIQSIREMASANVIKDFRSEILAFRAEMQAQGDSLKAGLDAQNAKYNVLIWLVGGGGILLLSLFAYLLSQPWG